MVVISLIIVALLLLSGGYAFGDVWNPSELQEPYPELLTFSPTKVERGPGQDKFINLKLTGNNFLSNKGLDVALARFYETESRPDIKCVEFLKPESTTIISDTEAIGNNLRIPYQRDAGEEWYPALMSLNEEGYIDGGGVIEEDIGVFTIIQTDFPYTWYFAEGSTGGDQQTQFETWISVVNPQDTTTAFQYYFLTDKGFIMGSTHELFARTRQTINIADFVPDTWSVSTVIKANEELVVSRSMFWNNRVAGHCSLGTQELGKRWCFPEGSTDYGFETWILVQNPGEQEATVEINYLQTQFKGEIKGPTVKIPAKSRISLNVADTVPNCASVSTEIISDQDVVVEGAMYWNNRQGGIESAACLMD